MDTQLNRHDYLLAIHHEVYRFSLADLQQSFQNEIDKYDPNVYEPAQRGARLTAAVKRYKTSEMIKWILTLSKDENLDITPNLFNKIAKGLFSRTGCNHLVQKILNQSGRKTKSATNNDEIVEYLINKYQEEAESFWKGVYDEVEVVKHSYQKKIHQLTK